MKTRNYLLVIIILNTLFGFISENPIAQPEPAQKNDQLSTNLSKDIEINVTVEKELFPVISKLQAEGNSTIDMPKLVNWNFINNNLDSIKITVSSSIPEWTSPVINLVILGPGESKRLEQTPFGVKLLENNSSMPATIILNVKLYDELIFEVTKNVSVRASDDMIWSFHSAYDCVDIISAWVTPKDDYVELILSNAKERIYNRSLSGYQSNDVMKQIRAIFNAVRNQKVSYVDSRVSFGQIGLTQSVRLPRESIIQKSANCIDGAVLFASLFENIGLEPVIVLIPGHGFVGVRTHPGSNEIIFIETTIVGRSMLESILSLQKTFDKALELGYTNYYDALQKNPNDVVIVDIKEAREKGIYPLY